MNGAWFELLAVHFNERGSDAPKARLCLISSWLRSPTAPYCLCPVLTLWCRYRGLIAMLMYCDLFASMLPVHINWWRFFYTTYWYFFINFFLSFQARKHYQCASLSVFSSFALFACREIGFRRQDITVFVHITEIIIYYILLFFLIQQDTTVFFYFFCAGGSASLLSLALSPLLLSRSPRAKPRLRMDGRDADWSIPLWRRAPHWQRALSYANEMQIRGLPVKAWRCQTGCLFISRVRERDLEQEPENRERARVKFALN